MTSRRALVITFDRYPASILGCYGNEWIETPHLDHLAANGVVADACFAAEVGNQPTRSVSEGAVTKSPCLRSGLVKQSIAIVENGATFDTADLDQRFEIDGERGPDAKPDRIPLAEMVRRAKLVWTENRPQVLWLHVRGLSIPAEPPSGFAELYADEFEDRTVDFTALSDAEKAVHPLVTAGMASLLDHWLGELFALVAAEPDTLIAVTAAQGSNWQPLPNSFGELDSLRSQAVHVPWIVFHAGIAARRIAAPMSTRQFVPLLTAWFENSPELLGSNTEPVITRGPQATRITTRDWAAIFPDDPHAPPVLFAKPEDAWEVNNLAGVSPGVVDELRQAIQ